MFTDNKYKTDAVTWKNYYVKTAHEHVRFPVHGGIVVIMRIQYVSAMLCVNAMYGCVVSQLGVDGCIVAFCILSVDTQLRDYANRSSSGAPFC